MKKLVIAVIVILTGLTACKTTEQNYRSAYETAVSHREDASGVDSTIYARIRNSARVSQLAVGTDTLDIRTEYIGYPDGGGSSRENVERYNVVVGQFKQIFNAKAMRQRLIEQGYEAMIVNTREPLYYVIAASCSTAAEAAEQLNRVKSDTKIVLKSPLPFILQPAHKSR